MKKIFLLITFLVLPQIIVAQKKIKLDIEIKGNKSIPAEKYVNWITAEVTKSDNIKDIKRLKNIIRKKLNQQGYFDSEITNITADTTAKKDSLKISFQIKEGKQTRVNKIFISPQNKTDSLLYWKYFKRLEGNIFYQSDLENQIEQSLKTLENSGFPFVSVKINSLKFGYANDSSRIVDIYLHVKKEKLCKIDKVEILGNTDTKSSVILNVLRFRKGELYSQKKIDEIPLQLNKLRFFEPVEKPKYYFNSNDEGVLQITVKEKSTNSFDGILGYIPPTQSNDGYFTGFVNIALRNILGTGRAAGIKWLKQNSLSQELQVRYLEPWLFNYPFNLNLYLYQRKQDSTFVLRRYGGGLEYLATKNISASFIVESEAVIPSLDVVNVKNSTSFNSGLKIQLDYRDDILVPQNGIYFSSLYKLKSKTDNNNLKETTLHQYEMDFAVFYSVFKNQIAALGLHAKEIISDNFEESDYFRLGGANSLRGYKEQQFLGNRILWSNLEYRFLLSSTSYLFVLYDAGYYLRNENVDLNLPKISEYKSAYGIGLSIDTALGIMRISYALANGNSFSEGLIHFGLLNEF